MCAFETLAGLKINFHKSKLFCLGEAKEKTEEYIQVFGCKEVHLPLNTWVFQCIIRS